MPFDITNDVPGFDVFVNVISTSTTALDADLDLGTYPSDLACDTIRWTSGRFRRPFRLSWDYPFVGVWAEMYPQADASGKCFSTIFIGATHQLEVDA